MTQSSPFASDSSFFFEEGFTEIFGKIENTQPDNDKTASSARSVFRERLIHAHGIMETRGMYIRAGRAALPKWLSHYSTAMGWEDVEFKLLPQAVRTNRALSGFLDWMEKEYRLHGDLKVTAQDRVIRLHFTETAMQWLDCQFVLGMLQELVSWAGGGKFFPARETDCQGNGADACVFVIENQPVN